MAHLERVLVQTAQTRRRVLSGLAALGAGGVLNSPAFLAATERLETTAVRLANDRAICEAPLMTA